MGFYKGVIYAIENKVNGKMYIGLTRDIKTRIRTHKNRLKSNRHSNPHLQNSYNKYGKDSFEFKIIEDNIPNKLLGTKEKQYIEKYETLEKGYNLKSGGEKGWKFSEEVLKKMSDASKGENHPNFGKSLPKEVREKISNSHKGKELSKAHKESIGNFFRGCTLKQSHKNKISEALTGRSFSKEHRENISAAMSGRESSFYNNYKTEKAKLKASPVTKDEGVEIYNKYNNENGYSYRKLAEIYNIGKTTVENIVRGKHITTRHLPTPEKQKSYLDKKEAQNIFDEYHKKGKSTKEIIADHGFTVSTICRVVNGDHWATEEMEVE